MKKTVSQISTTFFILVGTLANAGPVKLTTPLASIVGKKVVTAIQNTATAVVAEKKVQVIANVIDGPSKNHCADYSSAMRVYWGDLHSHSSFSFDAAAYGTRNDPTTGYAYARGKPIISASGATLKIDRPLDFVAATDHSEFLGLGSICLDKYNPNYNSVDCVAIRYQYSKLAGETDASVGSASGNTGPPSICENFPLFCIQSSITRENQFGAWKMVQIAAAKANDPCHFTSFNAYEYTLSTNFSGNSFSSGGNGGLHRNVIFANEKVPAVPFDSVTYTKPQQLWNALSKTCTEAEGCDAVVIPHNSNLSNGSMWATAALSTDNLKLMARYERLTEIIQAKGSSECLNPNADDLSTSDCNFEIKLASTPNASISEPANWKQIRSGYVRQGLKQGLSTYQTTGVNPIQMGFVGGTDNHNAAPGGVAEIGYQGNHGTQDSTPLLRVKQSALNNPGGITGVWAEENTRESLFKALKSRRTYATSGPRMIVKAFATLNTKGNPCTDPGFPAMTDVLMGGNMGRPDWGIKPKYVVNVLMDNVPIAQVDFIKATLDQNGNSVESVQSFAATNTTQGDSSLCRSWVDNGFDSTKPSFVYVRVLEMPTWRWAHYDCQGLQSQGVLANDPSLYKKCFGDLAASPPLLPADRTIQERAWSSPIWFLPNP